MINKNLSSLNNANLLHNQPVLSHQQSPPFVAGVKLQIAAGAVG